MRPGRLKWRRWFSLFNSERIRRVDHLSRRTSSFDTGSVWCKGWTRPPMKLGKAQRRVAALIFLGALALLTVGCGGGEGGGEANGTTTAPSTMTTMTTTSKTMGNVAAGKAVFASAGCGGCHTFKAAGATGTTGPDLDEHLSEHKKEEGAAIEEHVRESVLETDAEIAEGYAAGVMPSYRTRLSKKQTDDLVAFIVANVAG